MEPFKLSDLMRLGSESTRQVFNSWGDSENTACALTSVITGLRMKGFDL